MSDENVRLLASKLVSLSVYIERLHKTRNAIIHADSLVKRALHYGVAARGEMKLDFESIYTEGFEIMSALSEKMRSESVDVEQAFLSAVKGDAVVGSALDEMHNTSPMGELWTGEAYPLPD